MTYEFRLAAGTLTAAALNASSAYLLENLAVQSDQKPYLQPWGPPMDHKTMYPRYQASAQNQDLSQRLRGYQEWDWLMAYWTEGMVSYFETAFWNGAGSAPVTVKTIKRNGVYAVYTATMLYPNESDFMEPSERGLEQYKIRFRGAVAI